MGSCAADCYQQNGVLDTNSLMQQSGSGSEMEEPIDNLLSLRSMEMVPVILMAEDDPNDVFFFRRAFQKAEIACQILDVPNGQDAIQYLEGVGLYANRSDYPLPNLLLLDLKMPLMSGFDVLEW